MFVIDGERLTSAGVTSGVDLMLHVVAALTGAAVAVAVARYLVVYLRRSAADPQLSPWLEGRNHIHPAIHRAQDAIAAEPARAWSLSSVARVAATSPRNLSRLFNQHTGMSVTTYVNRMRVALARQLVLGSHLDIETVAERSRLPVDAAASPRLGAAPRPAAEPCEGRRRASTSATQPSRRAERAAPDADPAHRSRSISAIAAAGLRALPPLMT